MAAFSLAVDARCPLCGSPVLSVNRGGQVVTQELRLVPLTRSDVGNGYTLCDDCGVLTTLPRDLTLN